MNWMDRGAVQDEVANIIIHTSSHAFGSPRLFAQPSEYDSFYFSLSIVFSIQRLCKTMISL